MTNRIAHNRTGTVRIPAAMRRDRFETGAEKRCLVPKILRGRDIKKPSMVPANDIWTVSQRASPATGRTLASGGSISKVKVPIFRNPFISRAASKKPNWPSTMLRRMATKAITKRSVLTAIPRKGDAPGARLSGTGERFVRDRGSGHGQQTRELTVSHAYSPGRSFVPVRPPRA